MPEAPLPPLPPAGRPAWLTTVDELRARWRLGSTATLLGAMAALAVAISVVAVVMVLRDGTEGSAAGGHPAPAAPEPGGLDPTTTVAKAIVVDVAGAVMRPGLIRLPPGSRVADAIAAAGGATADADVRQVNQARPLIDGEQVLVPRRGEVLPPPPTGPSSVTPSGPLDLNSATAEDLDALPGVGPATAAAIVEWRTRNGRFRTVDDLLEVPGIGPAKLETLRPLVRV